MLNAYCLVGRLVSDPKIIETENDRKVCKITLAVPRNYKNADGIYETDFIRCILWNGIAKNTSEYCHKGDLVGVKGRLQTRKYEDENKEDKYITEVIVDKVSFLASKRETE